MRKCLLLLAFVVLPVRVEAAWVFVTGQTATGSGNDQTLTFTDPIGSGNVVLILVASNNETDTFSITDTTLDFASGTGLTIGPIDSAANTIRAYIFCAIGDGADATFTVTSSGTASAVSHGIEFSGGTCTQDGSTSSNDTSGTSAHTLSTDLSISGSASLIVSIIRSTSAVDFDAGTDMTQFGTDAIAAAAEYRILTTSGTFDTPWTSAVNETTMLLSAGFLVSGGAAAPCLRGLLGVGCNE